MSQRKVRTANKDGEFLWLVSFSDLLLLLFVFFVVLFSFAYQKLEKADFQNMSSAITGERSASTPIDEVQAKLLKWVVNRKLLDSVTIDKKQDALILQIKEKVLFSSGDYRLKDESRELIELISRAIDKIPPPYRLGIEGHTDDVPVRSKGISDNWELSARRAHSVLEALDVSDELRKRTVIMGYGEMNPLVPNRNDKGVPIAANQARNRRVTLRVF